MGSSSHGGERKGQLGLAITVPMSGTNLKRDEGWDPTINDKVKVLISGQFGMNFGTVF